MSDKMHETVQFFLTKFKKNSEDEKFSFYFKCNPNVNIVESQVPDLWLKTLTQFNKNDCFILDTDKSKELKDNLFPKTPFVIPNEESLNSRKLHIDKIEVDELFSDEMIRKTTGGSYESEDKNIDKEIKEDKENTNPNILSKENQSMFQMVDQNQIKKKWFLMAPNSMTFGPYSSEEIYVFLKNMNMKSPQETQLQKYMVVDSESDIYYKPEVIVEQLENECRDKIKPMDPRKELEKIVITKKKSFENQNQQFINNAQFQPTFQQMQMRERKLSDNPNKLITKYDVFEMNSRFKHAQYLPIKQLKQQLRSIKQNKEDEQNQNNNNNRYNYRKGSFDVQHSAKFGAFRNNNNDKRNRRYSYDEDLLGFKESNYRPTDNSKMKLVSIKETLFD